MGAAHPNWPPQKDRAEICREVAQYNSDIHIQPRGMLVLNPGRKERVWIGMKLRILNPDFPMTSEVRSNARFEQVTICHSVPIDFDWYEQRQIYEMVRDLYTRYVPVGHQYRCRLKKWSARDTSYTFLIEGFEFQYDILELQNQIVNLLWKCRGKSTDELTVRHHYHLSMH